MDEKLTGRLLRLFGDRQRDSFEAVNARLGVPLEPLAPLVTVRAESEQNIPEDKVKRFMRPSLFPLKADTVRESIANMEHYFYGDADGRTIQNLKRLLTAEIDRIQAGYLDQIRGQFAAQLERMTHPEEDALLDTLESLLRQLKDIII